MSSVWDAIRGPSEWHVPVQKAMIEGIQEVQNRLSWHVDNLVKFCLKRQIVINLHDSKRHCFKLILWFKYFFRKNISAWSLRSTPVILNSTICIFTRFISVVMDTDYGILFFTAHAVVFSEVVQPLMPNIRFVVSHVPFHLKVITPICWTSWAETQCLLRCDTKQSCVPALSSREGLHGWTSPPAERHLSFFSQDSLFGLSPTHVISG